MKPIGNIYNESAWKTVVNLNFQDNNIDYSKPITGHRSLGLNIFTSVIAIGMFLFFVYFFISGKFEFSLLHIFGLIGALIFSFLSLKGLFNQSREIKIDQMGITFDKTETIKWADIKATFIRQRSYSFTRGSSATIERLYLDIETVFSGIYSKRAGLHTYEITGLTRSASEIEHYVELFKIRFAA